jgi:hypothetical protein
MQAARGQSPEDRVARGLFVEMKWLGIEFGGECLDSTFPRFPRCCASFSVSLAHRRNEIRSWPTLGSQNGEQLGRAAPELVALPSLRRTSAVVVCRI